MKIAILASNQRPIPSPPDLIFAPGVLIYEMTEELVRRGHDLTLFAPEGTKTSAKLVTAGTKSSYEEFAAGGDFIQKRAANLHEYTRQSIQYELLMAAVAFESIDKNDFDIVHSHKTLHEIYFTNFIDKPCVFTFHDPPQREAASRIDVLRLKKYAKTGYFVSVSNFQRTGIEFLNFIDTVYHGIKIDDFEFSEGGDEGLLFVGRLEKKKGADIAVKVAKMTNKKLTLIGDPVIQKPEEKAYFDELSREIDKKQINYLGHVPFNRMVKYYRNRKAFLFPIRSQESFGLVMIEAMACGTPVVAFDRGSVPEIIKDGETGFICPPDDIEAMVKAVKRIYEMPEEKYRQMRQNCRKHVEENFTVERMVNGYEKVYQKVIDDWKEKHG
ncbi:MAG: glycosyltransferase family 4 protein [Patescibacteria group bacterium]